MSRDVIAKRERMVREIQRTRLGGIDRVADDDFDADRRRFAHIFRNDMGVNLHTTDHPGQADPIYAASDGWTSVGVIDLDTGHLVSPPCGEGTDA